MQMEEAWQVYVAYAEARNKSQATIYGYNSAFRKFVAFQEQRYGAPWHVENIRFKDTDDYVVYLRKSFGYGTVTSQIGGLRSIYNSLCRADVTSTNPFRNFGRIEGTGATRGYLDKPEALRLIRAIRRPVLRIATQVAIFAGPRAEELCSLSCGDVDLKNGTLRFVGKGRVGRVVQIDKQYLEPELRAYISMYHGNNVDGFEPFFRTASGRLSPSTLNLELARVSEKLGASQKITLHVLRHSYAMMFVANGGTEIQLKDDFVHKDMSTTSKYLHGCFSKITFGKLEDETNE